MMGPKDKIQWAEQLINRAVEIMTVDQLSQWDGVRAWLEQEPVCNCTTPDYGEMIDGWACRNCGFPKDTL